MTGPFDRGPGAPGGKETPLARCKSRQERDFQEALDRVLGTVEGRLVFDRLIHGTDFCHLGAKVYRPNSESAFLDGESEAGRKLLALLEARPTFFRLFASESTERRIERTLAEKAKE